MKKIALLLVSLCTAIASFASYTVESIPNPKTIDATAWVANPDGILSAEEVTQLTEIANKMYKYSEVEFCVVAVKSIDNADPMQFSLNLFNLWGIGNKDRNTGVLLFLAIREGAIEIRTGGGIEGILTDAKCGDILDSEAMPLLYQENKEFGKALIAVAKEIGRTVTTDEARYELLLDTKLPEPSTQPWGTFSIISLLISLITWIKHLLKPKCLACGKRELILDKEETLVAATEHVKGLGKRYYHCAKCGATQEKLYDIPKLYTYTEHSGGSYSGGGGRSYHSSSHGGSFGGGHSFGGGAGRHF